MNRAFLPLNNRSKLKDETRKGIDIENGIECDESKGQTYLNSHSKDAIVSLHVWTDDRMTYRHGHAKAAGVLDDHFQLVDDIPQQSRSLESVAHFLAKQGLTIEPPWSLG